MIEKTPAIVLRFYPYSNTSRYVSWLTPRAGRIMTMIKGSQRPKSGFLGQYDLFYTCELLYYIRDRTGLHIARECSPIKTRPNLRRDWRAAAAASYFCDAATRVSPPNAPHGHLFALLDTSLDHLARNGVSETFVFWFELKLLDVLGFAPHLQHCLECGETLTPGRTRTRFSYIRGGLLCSRCSKRTPADTTPIAPDIVAMLTAWQKAVTPRPALSTRCTRRQLDQTERLLGQFLVYHLDTPLNSRPVAFDILRRKIA